MSLLNIVTNAKKVAVYFRPIYFIVDYGSNISPNRLIGTSKLGSKASSLNESSCIEIIYEYQTLIKIYKVNERNNFTDNE
ncbi:7195_t:CDS:2 [Funneliformis geosporum]|uniref:7195_t:CDS:1 n=1 Tax=Funneliformis geosporum TaxID=1117311 RepID=A0A9W4SIX2_9GLOM|nr:7195_t:CDS:2 [Funneliformis geosporum]